MHDFDVKNISIFNSKLSRSTETVSGKRKTALFELELPLENGGTSYMDAESERITKNVFITAKPNQIRHTKFPYKCRYVHLSVTDEYLSGVLSSVPNFLHIKNRESYDEIFDELHKYFSAHDEAGKIMVQSLILKLIFLLHKESGMASEDADAHKSSTVKKAIDYIRNNLSADLSLENISKSVAMSPIHFHNRFKAATGKTLRTFVEDERLKEAINLMLTTDMTLTEIAFACGFSSQSYFSYAFKRKMRTTPRKYVQALNSNYEI